MTICSCNTAAAVAARTEGARRRRRENRPREVVADQTQKLRMTREVLARGLERGQDELKTERARGLGRRLQIVPAGASSSKPTKETAKRKIPSTHAKPKGSRE